MPSRIIREGWVESERINLLDAASECFFIRLLLRADDYGRYHANPTLLKSNLFPLREDVRSTDIPRLLAACEKAGLVRCYEVAGKRYVEVPRFDQRTRAKNSKFPPPPINGSHPPDPCQTDGGHMRTYADSDSESLSESERARGLPDSLNTPKFSERWLRWQAHWSATFNFGNPMPEMTAHQHLRFFVEIGEDRAIVAINHSISMGNWRAPAEPKTPPPAKPRKILTAAELEALPVQKFDPI